MLTPGNGCYGAHGTRRHGWLSRLGHVRAAVNLLRFVSNNPGALCTEFTGWNRMVCGKHLKSDARIRPCPR